MTDEIDGTTPPRNPQPQAPAQPPVTPAAPQEGALPNDRTRETNNEQNETEELAGEFRAAEKWVVGTNIVLAIVGIVALCIYYGQLRVMRGQLGEIIRQYPEIKKGADASVTASRAATESLNTLRQQYQEDRRPRVVIESMQVIDMSGNPTMPAKGQPLIVNIEFRNIGKTPALNLMSHKHVAIGVDEALQMMPEPIETTKSADVAQPEIPSIIIAMLLKHMYNEQSSVPFTEFRPWDGTPGIFVFGRITYNDEHGVEYCTPILRQLNQFNKGGNSWIVPGIIMVPKKHFRRNPNDFCPTGRL